MPDESVCEAAGFSVILWSSKSILPGFKLQYAHSSSFEELLAAMGGV